MSDILSIIIPIVLSLIFIGVSFYLYAIFCHPQDSGIGTTIFAKIIIILGQSLSWAQLLIIILDLSIYEQNPQTIMLIYDILYILIFILTVCVLPFISALYQSDQDDSMCKRIVSSIIYAIIISFVWSAFTFLSYIGLSIYTDQSNTTQRVPMALYIMLCQALVGWILLVVNGTLGLVFVPYDLIMDFLYRPRLIDKQEAYDIKKELQDRSDELIQQGQKLIIQQQQFKQKSISMNFFTRKRQQSNIQKLIKKFKNNINQLQKDYQTFNQQLNYSSQNPVIPYLKLILGILSIIISIVWIVQIFGHTIHIDNHIFYSLSLTSTGFISVILYGILALYMQICLIKGNTIFGVRIPFIMKFHSLQINKTFFNSFLFNIIIMLLSSISILHMSILVFPSFLDNSYLGQFFIKDVINNLPLFGFMYGDRIYLIVFLSFVGVAILYLIVKICRNKRMASRRRSVEKDK